ncbi:hypothetical protein PV04_03460 [Phialophora macrospora]|uniref:EthD domain-containing protein n=1 Tax=Phialophora macrospora TaxID=1851006 RepID=A0A0D2EAC9_9EURO|nr:hypothetical protein PV04_03460 [Phialophora macrospora]
MASVEVLLLYQDFDGLTFDMDYYVNQHMPMSVAYWKQFGFQSWRMLKLSHHLRTGEKPFSYATIMTFDHADNIVETLQSAFRNGSLKPVADDVPNFCNTRPLFLVGEHVVSWP